MSEEHRLHRDHVSLAIAPRPAPIRHEGYWITLEPVDPCYSPCAKKRPGA